MSKLAIGSIETLSGVKVALDDLTSYILVEDTDEIRSKNLSGIKQIRLNTRGNPIYKLNTTDTTSVDDDFLVIVDTGGNRWKLVHNGTIDVRYAGLVLDGSTDNSAAFQAAHDALVALGYTFTLDFGGDNNYCKFNSAITVDTYFCSIKGTVLWDFSAMSTGDAITVKCSVGTEPANSYSRKGEWSGNIRIKGAGAATATYGLVFDSAVANSNAAALMSGVSVFNFGVNCDFRNRAYNCLFLRCEFHTGGIPIRMGSGYTDYGEKIVFSGCVIYNNLDYVTCNNPDGAFHFQACSFDYNAKQFKVQQGRVFLDGCHVEATNYTVEPFVVGSGNGATLIMNGGWLLCVGSNTVSIVNCTTTALQGGGAYFNNVSMNNLGTAEYFATGNGVVEVNGVVSYDTRLNPLLLSAKQNRLMDGSFEGATVVDATIAEDTAAITSRTSGTNINLTLDGTQFRSGTQSLKATKAFGSGSKSSFRLLAPVDRNMSCGKRIFYKKPGSQTGTMTITHGWVNVVYDQAGVPIILKAVAVGSLNVVFNASAVDWTEFKTGEPVQKAPAWATHAYLTVSMFAMNAGDLYFDDAIFTQM